MADTTTPCMLEAEQFVIGACLLSENAIGKCAERNIESKHFFNNKCRTAWDAIIGLYRNSKVVDILTAKKAGANETFMNECIEIMCTESHLEHFIEVLEEYEKYRRVYMSSSVMMDEAVEATLPASELLSKSIESLLGNVDTTRLSVNDCHEMHKEKRNRAKREGIVGHPVQLEPLKAVMASWEPPDNIIISGKSSSGKTDFCLSELLPQALAGKPIGIYETDMTQDQLLDRMAGNMANVNIFRFKHKNWTDEEAWAMDEAYKILDDAPIYINDKANSTIQDVMFYGTLCGIKHKCDFFMFDFLTQLEFTRDELRMPTRTVIGQHSAKIKSLGKRHNYVTFLVSQLSRYGEKTSDVTPPIANKEALKESGDIENNADAVILVCKAPDRPISEFSFQSKVWDMVANVDKQRNGPTGIIEMSFEPRFHQFFSRTQGDVRRLDYDKEECDREQAKANTTAVYE